jgi:hypothetical protein
MMSAAIPSLYETHWFSSSQSQKLTQQTKLRKTINLSKGVVNIPPQYVYWKKYPTLIRLKRIISHLTQPIFLRKIKVNLTKGAVGEITL